MKNINTQNKVALKTNQGARLIDVDQIMYVEAKENYSKLVLVEQEYELICKTLKYIDNHFAFSGFVRCHKSYLVNIQFIKELNCNGECKLILTNKNEIPVSRSGLKIIKELLYL